MFKNEKGMTLIELLAALALMSIIIALIGSAHIFGQKQYRNQTEEINYQEQVRYVMATITKEIRSTEADQVSVISENEITIGTNSYELVQPIFYKNSTVLSDQISDFNIVEKDGKLEILISSLQNRNGKIETLSTVIYLRE
ncbi:PilW family protein [Paraliobacillus sediminis]|uniref:PilW family protein n=1 Tax=Paraliobacillus sediminis TaxID=1885916 RepID=UPI0013C311E2|nr:prepilin-type N-terminal cleavage/methylation domain-containing protein [Paraliobacillus sediminis]